MLEKTDEGKIKSVDDDATALLIKRSGVYGTQFPAWRFMSIDAILCGVIYKSDRARVTKDLNKKYDDIKDAINYLRFVGVRVKEEIECQKSLSKPPQ